MKAMIIPGNGNTPITNNWNLYVKSELEKLSVEVIAENMPDADLAREKFWIPFMEQKMGKDENVILIGHSSGAVAIMRFLENHKILGTVLVGACYTDLAEEKEKISGYYNRPWNWEKIKENAGWIIQFASTDDPYISKEEFRHINNMLETEYHEYKNRGHFDEIEFPELVFCLRMKLGDFI